MRIAFAVLMTVLTVPTFGAEFGDCSDSLQAEWLEDGRLMKLLKEYSYVDGSGKAWIAPAGSMVDGASIPRFVWPFIGGPYEGKYRKASVTHDVECEFQKEDWRQVHRMFYDAMRCSEVEDSLAKIMYAAVFHCGPRWGDDQGLRLLPCNEDFGAQLVRRLRRYLHRNPESSAPELAELGEGDLEGVSGEGPLEALGALPPRVSVEERLEGFVIRISGFTPGGSSVSESAAEVLKRAAPLLNSYATSVEVQGYADAFGTNEFNMALGYRRASNVGALMIGYGLAPEALDTTSYGEERPITSYEDAESLALERRVDIVIREIE